jgi:CubicO group peptidase (beta-lactamase class C family)
MSLNMIKFDETVNARWLMKKFIILFTAISIFACNHTPESKADEKRKFNRINLQYSDTNSPQIRSLVRSLDTFYANRVAAGFNGSVLVGYKGKVLYERYFGYANKETGLMLAKNTPSQLASTSKPFTAMAVCLLKDRGFLAFDDRVQKYLPEFPYAEITIRELLNHRSGLPDYFHFDQKTMREAHMLGLPMNNQELMSILARKQPKLNFIPGTRFTYCNTNYATLSALVSRITKMSFPVFMKSMVFDELGMNNTYVYEADQMHPSNSARNYKAGTWQKDTWLDGTSGDKNVYSTVEDMYKWDQALYKGTFVKKKTLDEAYTPYSFEKPGVKNYGLGWRMLLYPNQKIIFHNGWWHGANTCFYRFLDDNFTIIVIGNKYNKSIYYQPMGIFNIINGPGSADQEWETE